MSAIPLLSGIAAKDGADLGVRYPTNLEPVPVQSGLSNGYLRSAAGCRTFATGPGPDRGAIVWNGVMYRVMGAKLVRVPLSGSVVVLGDVGGTGPVSMDYGFDLLAIRSGTSLFYWNGTTLSQVTDPDLGQCLDVVWMDGYYISTDGTSIVVTDLANPSNVNPLKYGSAEADPDMVVGLLRARNELAVLGQNTIEFYNNVGGSGFPFQVNEGALIPIGCVGPRAKCLFSQSFAFVGGGRNHASAVWLAGGGTAEKLSTRAIDDMLEDVEDQSSIQLETRVARDESRLLVHLPDKTLVYLRNASATAQEPVWYVARSGRSKVYRPRNAVLWNGEWAAGDVESGQIGILDETIADHFGEPVGWQFETKLLYNAGKSGILHDLELVGLPGRGGEASVLFSYTLDGETWSVEREIKAGGQAQRGKRVFARPHKRFRRYMGLRFRGDSAALAGWATLEATLEPLSA